MPVYNTESYLQRAIDSVIASSYSNIELIIIDDGSTDTSSIICERIATLDSRIKFYRQNNQGVAAARNLGLSYASGKYVLFVDSDDELPKDSLLILVTCMEKNNKCDLAVGGFTLRYTKNEKYYLLTKDKYTLSEIAFLIATDNNAQLILSTVWGKIFLREIITNNKLLFIDTLLNGEDGLFILDYLNHCNNVSNTFLNAYVCYRYEFDERINTVSWIYPDFFEYIYKQYVHLFSLISEIKDKKELNIFYANYCNYLIIHLVRAAAYEDFFSKGELYERIKKITNSPFTKTAIRAYKAPFKGASILIPVCIWTGMVRLLLWSLRMRAKDYLSNNGKSNLVRTIYRNIQH